MQRSNNFLWNSIIAVLLVGLSTLGAGMSMAETTKTLFTANGMSGSDATGYTFQGKIDGQTGEFSGAYVLDLPVTGSQEARRRAAKRLWDLKLKIGGTGPNIPQSIYELGSFDLIVESSTTMAGDVAEYESVTTISGGHRFARIDISYEEPQLGRGRAGLEQTSHSVFRDDGPGRILFETAHRDDFGEHSITRGIIYLRGAPDARLDGPVYMRFRVSFTPDEQLNTSAHGKTRKRSGRFSGKVEVTPRRMDLPYDPAVVFKGPGKRVEHEYVDFRYEVSEEFSTTNLTFDRYPDRANLPFSLETKDGELSISFHTDAAGQLFILGTVQTASFPCPNKRCNLSQTACTQGILMKCWCGRVGGALICSHSPCSSGGGGGGGGVGLGSTDFAVEVPPGEW